MWNIIWALLFGGIIFTLGLSVHPLFATLTGLILLLMLFSISGSNAFISGVIGVLIGGVINYFVPVIGIIIALLVVAFLVKGSLGLEADERIKERELAGLSAT